MNSPYRENQQSDQDNQIETTDVKVSIWYLDENNNTELISSEFIGQPNNYYGERGVINRGHGLSKYQAWEEKIMSNQIVDLYVGDIKTLIPLHRILKITSTITKRMTTI